MKLPLKINRSTEAYVVRDANGFLMAHVVFDADIAHRDRRGLLDEATAREHAKVIARALTDAKEAGTI